MKMVLIAAMLVASPATAAPTYLACDIVMNGKPTGQMNITADEANQEVTLEIPATGLVERHPAVFSQKAVSFNSPSSFGSIEYDISRTDLEIVQTISAPMINPIVSKGTCHIQAAPQRAF